MGEFGPFWSPDAVSTIDDPLEVRLWVGYQHSQFLLILARFMDLFSLFGVMMQISRLLNPEGRSRVSYQH